MFFSCTKKTLRDNAVEQMEKEIYEKIHQTVEDVRKIDIQNVKTVYQNDSICMLQCEARLSLPDDSILKYEYRYIYLIDVYLSRFSGEMVYNHSLQDFPCMPDDLIEKCRKDVERNHESVYESMFPSTLPVVMK